MPQILPSSAPAPPTPKYILRGHTSQIHATHFLRRNTRLLTGDATGYVVLWDTTTKRPVAVWRAHDTTILALGHWPSCNDRIITHGRDHRIKVWQLRSEDEGALSRVLLADEVDGFSEGRTGKEEQRAMPWLLHSVEVNALNFCGFAVCAAPAATSITGTEGSGVRLHESPQRDAVPDTPRSNDQSILIAVPGVKEGDIIIHALPFEKIVAAIPADAAAKTGMLMALRLIVSSDNTVTVVAGYESGAVAVFRQVDRAFERVLLTKAHSQPVLSIDVSPGGECAFSSGADAAIVRYDLRDTGGETVKIVQTKHAGQQSLAVRSDGRIFATAGWDGRMRVYSAQSMKELAVLKWHKEGCYALAFAEVLDDNNVEGASQTDRDESHGSSAQAEMTRT
ncbi:hypothetical protein MBLNU457_5243t1 [Dothideomycetes sp. NU457]